MKKFHKLIAFVLCFMLVIPAIPFTASAAVNSVANETAHYSQPLFVNGVETEAIYTQIQTSKAGYYQSACVINAVEVPAGSSTVTLEALNCGTYTYSKTNMANAAIAYNSSHSNQTVVAAINSSPWHTKETSYGGGYGTVKNYTIPYSLTVIDGEVWNTAMFAEENGLAGSTATAPIQANFAVTNQGSYVIGSVLTAVPIANITKGTSFLAGGLNRLPANNAIVVYNHRGGTAQHTYADAYEVYLTASDATFRLGVLTTATVTKIYESGYTGTRDAIDANTIVISARGTAINTIKGQFSAGDTVQFVPQVTGDWVTMQGTNSVWNTPGYIKETVGGFYTLYMNGTILGENKATNYPAPIIGIKADGTAVIVSVTSKTEGTRAASQMRYLPYICQELGLVQAIMGDGGGSAQFVTLDGTQYVRRATSSDGAGTTRPVVNGWGVVYHGASVNATSSANGTLKLLTKSITPTITPGSGTGGSTGGGTVTGTYYNVSIIDSMNGEVVGQAALLGAPLTMSMVGSLNGSNLSFKGWSIVNGGTNGDMKYSVDGGTTWNDASTTYSTAGSDVTDTAALCGVTGGSGTNGRFDTTIDLSAHAGKTVTVLVGRLAKDGTVSLIATITGVAVPEAAHVCSYSNYTSNGNGTHSGKCSCGATSSPANCSGNSGYTSTGSGTHTATCSTCGGKTAATACTPNGSYTSAGNGTHTSTCSQCGGTTTATACSANTWTTDGSYHWKVCSSCNTEIASSKASHTGTATCQAAATCTTCGKQYGGAGNHTYVTVAGKQPTCTQTGLTAGEKCSYCGAVKTAQTTIPATGHTEVVIPAVAATCQTTGLTAGVKCSACNTTIKAQTTTPKADHVYAGGACTMCGASESCSHVYTDSCDETCNNCNETRSDAHPNRQAMGAAADPTCTQPGYTEGYICPDCDEIVVEPTELEAYGHTETTIAGFAATCSQTGLTDGKKCSACGEILESQTVIPAQGHTEETIAGYEATCTEEGLTDGKKCSACGDVTVEQEPIAKKAHTEETIAGYEATCTESGLTDGKKCSECNTVIEEQTATTAKGHSYTDYVYNNDKTCTVDGTETAECDNGCGTTDTRNAEGYAAQGHDWAEATCEEPMTCLRAGCGATIGDANGHSYGEWVTTLEPTEETNGERRRDCENCDKFETDIIAALNHDHSNYDVEILPAVDPTCTTMGKTEGQKCSGCGEILVAQDDIAPLDHNYVGGVCTGCGNRICSAHEYDNRCDAFCNNPECGYQRETINHYYTSDCDTTCNECQAVRNAAEHVYSNDCDAICDECDAEREVGDHVYSADCDAICNECGATRDAAAHVVKAATCKAKAYCEVCGVVCGGVTDQHVYDNDCDAICNECGKTREITHSYKTESNGSFHWKECSVCHAKKNVADHAYDSICDATCNCRHVRAPEHDFKGDVCDKCGNAA